MNTHLYVEKIDDGIERNTKNFVISEIDVKEEDVIIRNFHFVTGLKRIKYGIISKINNFINLFYLETKIEGKVHYSKAYELTEKGLVQLTPEELQKFNNGDMDLIVHITKFIK